MPFFKLPKTLRWLGAVALLLLLLLNSYRLGICLYFYKDFWGQPEFYRSLWMGFRFDCRIVGGITLLLLLISFLPGVHFFKRSWPQRLAMVVYGLAAALLFSLYALDLAHLFITKQRLDLQTIYNIKVGNADGVAFVKTTPFVTLGLIVAISVWVFLLVVAFIHRRIGRQNSSDERWVRIYWQVMFCLLSLVGIYGRIGKEPLHPGIAKLLPSAQAQTLAVNPLEALVYSIFTADSAAPKDAGAP
ncbi:MAG: hypothetical protein EAY75_08520 [Bacteroidetes bacterium]|nr:MAG: hypothetical protein EAY75_08520 [Bacteroidota bacterium]